jgi:hypothetical protein
LFVLLKNENNKEINEKKIKISVFFSTKSEPAGFSKPPPVHRFHRFTPVFSVFFPVLGTSGLQHLPGPVL